MRTDRRVLHHDGRVAAIALVGGQEGLAPVGALALTAAVVVLVVEGLMPGAEVGGDEDELPGPDVADDADLPAMPFVRLVVLLVLVRVEGPARQVGEALFPVDGRPRPLQLPWILRMEFQNRCVQVEALLFSQWALFVFDDFLDFLEILSNLV